MLIEKLSLPECYCGKIAKYKAIEDGKIIFYCRKHLPSDSKEKISEEPKIELNLGGLFKSKSLIEISSKLAFEGWKDFGLPRDTLLKQRKTIREAREVKASAEKVFISSWFFFGELFGEILWHGEKLNLFSCKEINDNFLVCSKLGTPLFWVDKQYKFIKTVL